MRNIDNTMLQVEIDKLKSEVLRKEDYLEYKLRQSNLEVHYLEKETNQLKEQLRFSKEFKLQTNVDS